MKRHNTRIKRKLQSKLQTVLDNPWFFQTVENVIDGTRCTYDNQDDVCVQGMCIHVGCDKVKTVAVVLQTITKTEIQKLAGPTSR